MGKRVLVTGAFGKIGNLLVQRLLKQGYIVRCLVRPSEKNKKIAKNFHSKFIEIFYGDMVDNNTVEKATFECDFIIHLGFAFPEAIKNKKLSDDINKKGTQNVVEASDKNGCKLIFASTIAVDFYEKGVREKDGLRYIEYIKDKVFCENIVKNSNLDWSILRIGAVLFNDFPDVKDMVHIPYDTKFEFIFIDDLNEGIIESINKFDKINKKIIKFTGGKEYQKIYGDFINDISKARKEEPLSKDNFSKECYYSEWVEKDNNILEYKKSSYKSFLKKISML